MAKRCLKDVDFPSGNPIYKKRASIPKFNFDSIKDQKGSQPGFEAIQAQAALALKQHLVVRISCTLSLFHCAHSTRLTPDALNWPMF